MEQLIERSDTTEQPSIFSSLKNSDMLPESAGLPQFLVVNLKKTSSVDKHRIFLSGTKCNSYTQPTHFLVVSTAQQHREHRIN